MNLIFYLLMSEHVGMASVLRVLVLMMTHLNPQEPRFRALNSIACLGEWNRLKS